MSKTTVLMTQTKAQNWYPNKTSRRKWADTGIPLDWCEFLAFTPNVIVWDSLSSRAISAGFLMNWPYIVVKNSLLRHSRFNHARIINDRLLPTEGA